MEDIKNYQDHEDPDGNTILHIAAATGCVGLLRYIISQGRFNINGVNCMGWTPLMQASRFGHVDCVQFLITKSADVSQRNKYGLTALSMAVANGDPTIIKMIQHKRSHLPKEPTPMIFATLFGNKDSFLYVMDQSNIKQPSINAAG